MRRISAAWRSLREESYFCAATLIFLCAESRRSMCRNDGIGGHGSARRAQLRGMHGGLNRNSQADFAFCRLHVSYYCL